MLYNLSVKNLKKSIGDYTIYFFTLLLGVCIFYMFNAIEDQTAMMELSRTKSNLIGMMNTALSVISILVSVILGFLIVYASRFLLRRRTKEFGIYLTLGMRRGFLAWLLFLETLIVGIFSLVIGLVLGIAGSQFMSLLVSGLFKANMERFVFVVSKSSLLKTILYYAVIYLIVIVFQTLFIIRTRLIDLLLASRKKEKVYLQRPSLCLTVFLAACGLLGYAYYQVTAGSAHLTSEADVLLPILLGIVGTFLFFWSVSGLMLGISRRCKALYFKGTNSFVLNETGSRIHSFMFAGSLICLLLFVTICALSGAFTLKTYKENLIQKRTPRSISMKRDCADGQSVQDRLRQKGFDMNALTNTAEFFTWECDAVSFFSIFKEASAETIAEKPFWEDFLKEPLHLIFESDYNAAADAYGFSKISLSDNQYLAFCENPSSAFNDYRGMSEEMSPITIGTQTLEPTAYETWTGYLMMSDEPSYVPLVIIPNSIGQELLTKKAAYLAADYANGYDTKEFRAYMDNGAFDKEINAGNPYLPGSILISTKSALMDNCVGLSSMAIFLALYIGMIFMICSAALLSLKTMSDAMDGRADYQVLRQLGARDAEVDGSLRRQMGIFFGFPLILAAVHSIFGIQVVYEMFSIYETDGILLSLILVAVMIAAVYGGYFVFSYHTCKKIIQEKIK